MKQLSIYLLGLVIAVAFVHIEAERTVIHPGGNFTKLCTAKVNSTADEDRLVQFFRDRVYSKVFGSKGESNDLRVISNNTEVDPLIIIKTDRFTVTKNSRGYYVLEIKNVTDSDSAWYGCRIFNKLTGSIDFAEASKELLVPGPIRSLFWTSNYKAHMVNSTHSDKYKIEDGGQVLVNNTWLGSSLGCALLVSNVEPTINITIGKLGEEGSIDITSDFQERSSSLTIFNEAGTQFRSDVFFIKDHPFKQTNIKNLYCTSSLYGVKFESHINVQFRSKPQNIPCSPSKFYALEGATDVAVTCLVPAHPYAKVNWVTEDNIQINETSAVPNYAVTNKEQFEGVLSTLTIAKVHFDRGRQKQFRIQAINSEGSGDMHLTLQYGDPTSGGPSLLSGGASLGLLILIAILL